jgi:hypothetical protein
VYATEVASGAASAGVGGFMGGSAANAASSRLVMRGSTVSNGANGPTNVTGSYMLGGFVGYFHPDYDNTQAVNDTLEHCTARATVTSTRTTPSSYAGGFVGYLQNNAAISNCSNTGNITGTAPIPDGYTIDDTDADNIDGPTENDPHHAQIFIGGITGGNFNGGGQVTITDCTSTGDMTSTAAGWWAFAAGIMGGGSATLTDCTASGNLSASSQYAYAGGMSAYGGTFTGCYFGGTIAAGSYYARGPMDGHANGTGAAASGADGNGNTWNTGWKL